MERNMDLIRSLVLRIETFDPPPTGPVESFRNLDAAEPAMTFDGHSVAEVHYHVRLIANAGLLDAVRELPGSTCIMAKGLTWKGHDFADSVRDPEIWKKTKDGAKAAGGFTLDLLTALAKGFIKKKIEDHTGIKL